MAAAALLSAVPLQALAEVAAPVPAPPTLAADAVWEGDILVEAPLTVPAGLTLTIRPGASVRFRAGSGLTVSGTLRAEGTAERTVTFSAEGDGPWGGILLTNAEQPSTLRDCRILGARALAISGGEHLVESCEIAAGTVGVDVSGDGVRPVLRANRIRDMAEGGIRCLGRAAPLVERNTIERCGPFGVHASQGATPLVRDNTIVACASGIELSQTSPFVRDNRLRECERGIALSSADGGRPVQGNSVESCAAGILVEHFSSPEIAANTVTGNKEGIVCYLGAAPLIRNNEIRGNDTGISCNQMAAPRIEANGIERNRRGVFLTYSSYAIVRGNNFDKNDVHVELGVMSRDWERRAGNKPTRGLQQQAAVRAARGRVVPGESAGRDGLSTGEATVDARENWWGAATTAEMENKGADADIGALRDWHDVPTMAYEGFEGTYVQDRIEYAPWLKTPNAAAGLPPAAPAAGAGRP